MTKFIGGSKHSWNAQVSFNGNWNDFSSINVFQAESNMHDLISEYQQYQDAEVDDEDIEDENIDDDVDP